MDLKQEIQVMNQKDNNVSPEERQKWKIPEDPPVPKGNNRDIPVFVQELVYGRKTVRIGTFPKSFDRKNELIYSSEEVGGLRKDSRPSYRLDTHVLKRTSPTDKSLVEKLKYFVRGPEEKVGPMEALQASTTKNPPQKVPEKGKQEKGKGKLQVEQTLPTELLISKEGKDSHGQCVQYGKKFDGIKNKEGGRNESILSKERDLVKLVSHVEACNKESFANFNNFEYIKQKLGRDILQVKESQKTIIVLENVNKANILSLTHICQGIESEVTFLNQTDDNCISFITKKLKELIIKGQNLENSTGNNAPFLQENLEKSDKERIKFREDIQSICNNISLKIEL
ncbi:hypothetical protein O181_099283 [Austropuccinia psidii MF-1]|uniref:Uncharacterized protein n=1 Tax=Austropuccinia psidii MF-1 TaxID=1389203 RepID=A0A9Q3JAR4_9BASI|nr:hypothetical protein [Austropuccinia psidii MF-1]